MSLRIERDDRTITVISDDRNAENALLAEALETAAPHLLDGFNETPFEDELHFSVDAVDWASLLEALEAMEAEHPDSTGAALEQVEAAVKEIAA